MDILDRLSFYKEGETTHGWKSFQDISYENEFISLISVGSSNKWLSDGGMDKQWSIIVKPKQDFSSLPNFMSLRNKNIVSFTEVRRGENVGCFGIRLYEMSKDPDEEIIIDLLNFIFENAPVQLTPEESAILAKMTEQEIEATLNANDDSACYVYREGLNKIRKINQKIVNDLKKHYKGQCQLCGQSVGKEFGKEIVEAHHIEYFSKTQNNSSSNIIIVCPSCHALIHKCNPYFNKKAFCYEFDNGINIELKIIGHLQKE